jgi:hypothetical protein
MSSEPGVDAHVVLAFPDGAVMNVSEMTELLVADLLSKASRQAVTVSLKLGEVAAQVNPKKAFQTDFKLTTPSGTTSSRGTKFSVYYNPAARTTIVRTQVHLVAFQPNRPGAKTVLVPAGKEIQVNPSGISPLAPIGKAGARGGVDMQKAADLVLALIDHAATACNLAAPRGSVNVQPGAAGVWKVTVTVPGRTAGAASWTVANGKVKPSNALAQTIASGCPGTQAKAKPGHYTGQTADTKAISFDVTADSANATNLSAAGKVTCTDSSGWTWTLSSQSNNPISPSLGFSHSYTGGLTINDNTITNINVTYTLTGTLTTTGTATGSYVISHITWDQNSAHYDCTGTPTNWTAKLG